MSFNPQYSKSVVLLNRPPTPASPYTLRANALVTQGQVINGDLTPWFIKLELLHTGIAKTNSAILTLRVDQQGTFIRDNASPILVDQFTKNNYIVEIQLSQGANKGFMLRAMVGQPSIQDDVENGEILVIPMTGLQYIAKEWPISTEDYFDSPAGRFTNLIIEYTASKGEASPILNPFSINLPNDVALQQNWIPFTPMYLQDLLAEVIDRLANPLGGTFTDYYYDFAPDATDTIVFNVTAGAFGGISSGVVINPLSVGPAGTQQDNTWVTDNIRYKNECILICHPQGGSLPQAHTIFSSNWAHATIRPEWSPSGVYTAQTATANANLVRFTDVTQSDPNKRIRFFKCIANIGPGGLPPPTDPAHWFEDFTTNPLTAGFFSPSPWTNVTDFKTNMAGLGLTAGMSGFVGFFVDWNIARALYDTNSLTNPTNYFQTLSIKWVTDNEHSTPPTVASRQVYNGNRYLVKPPGINAWTGQDNRIAQWDNVNNVWQFSNAPTVGDLVMDMNKARVLRWNGSIWQIIWGIDSLGNAINFDKASPFHIVANLTSVTGPSGVPNTGIEATYTWVVPPLGDAKNSSSRGAWLSFWTPYPRFDTVNGGTGYLFGGDGSDTPVFPTLDSDNYNGDHQGHIGWNNGTISQDQGKISAIRFKLRVGMFTSTDDSAPVSFIANIPMTFWAIDLFDRVYYQDFKLRRNAQWDDVRIPFGYQAPMQLYFSRGDELPQLLGFTIPWDFTIKQKEFTGVFFDWRFVKGWGIMMKAPYTESGFYMAAQQSGWDQLTQYLQQGAANLWNLLSAPAQALFSVPIQANFIVHHSKIAIDELYFEKELIVTSNQTTVPLANPRVRIEHLETEQDYLNGVTRAQAFAARDSFFPQFWHMRAQGDVRLMFGQSFVASGNRVPGGTMNLVASEVKHIIDHDGYFMEVLGVRKFTTSG